MGEFKYSISKMEQHAVLHQFETDHMQNACRQLERNSTLADVKMYGDENILQSQ